jgi:gamma-glutamyl-gamma-aminobutyrate hydrolase PuuD
VRVGFTFGTKNPAWRVKIEPYLAALRAVDLEPVLVMPDAPLGARELAGWVIGGGTDIDPALYGETPHAENEEPDVPRDALESGILRDALALDLPVLAICRGMQMMNVVQGGTLRQHIEGHRAPGVAEAHHVRLVEDSRLAAITGSSHYAVNSRHHQAVSRLGQDLRMSGHASDGIVEALEHTGARFALAVQWHPEDRVGTTPEDLRLFHAFAHACVGGTI